jgi:exosortase family protein XrtF
MKGIRKQSALFQFGAKILAVYGLWYVIYDVWLLPAGWLDEWVSHRVVDLSNVFLSASGFDVVSQARYLRVANEAGIQVVDGCNGLSTIGLFIGFVLAFPGRWAHRAWFIPVGACVVFFANVFRVSLLAALQNVWPAGFEFVHGLGAPTFFYLIVFLLWVAWANIGDRTADSSPVDDKKSDRPQVAAAS